MKEIIRWSKEYRMKRREERIGKERKEERRGEMKCS